MTDVFPNYHLVEIKPGLEVKVASLRLNSEANIDLCQELGEEMSSDRSQLFLRPMPRIMKALRVSLAENHSDEEVDAALNELRYSPELNDPFLRCLFALLGRSITDDDDG